MKRNFTHVIALAISAVIGVSTVFAQTVMSPYCETAAGHFGTVEGTDPASHIYITIANSGENKVTVTIAPYDDNTAGVNYLEVPGFTPAGTANTGEAQEQLSVELTFADGQTIQNITVLWGNPGWDGRWQLNAENFNINSVCGECDLNTPPTVISAEAISTSSSSAEINVEGSDAAGGYINSWIVEIGGKRTDITDMESDGRITITGLNPNSAYSAAIYAKDRCNNISENSKTVYFNTESAEIECNGEAGHFGTPDNYRVSYAFEYKDGNLKVTLKPYDSNLTFRDEAPVNMAISSLPGEQPMTVNDERTEATYGMTVEEGTSYGIYFLFGLSDAAGNEMTAENLSDSEHLIYYAGGECADQQSAIKNVNALTTAIWPNPTDRYLNITSDEKIERIDILSPSGQILVCHSPNAESAVLDIASLCTGKYIVIVTTASGSSVETMLVH